MIDEYRQMLDEVCSGDLSTGERAAKLRDLLLDAEQAHRDFARDVLRDAQLAGLAKTIKAHQKAAQRVTLKKATRSSVIGVRRTSAGRPAWHQVPLDGVTWDELTAHIERAKTNARALGINARVAEKLLKLRDGHPSADGPGDALAEMGVTLEAYIEAAA